YWEMIEIPHNMKGRQLSADWVTAFDREFADYAEHNSVIRVREAWMLNRLEIFNSTKEDFIARLDKLPAGPGSENAQERLLAETFTRPEAPALPVYQQYRTVMLRHQEPFLKRTYNNTLDWFRAAGDGLSQAGRSTTHGFGSGGEQKPISR